ncbi:sugar ABC transporter ATP-binding protein [Candidatus Bipolaricaulota bacterium]|nr:sugar ABC transporter ATP-binding protein [Candidatus Bipolaricaulota bacterium]
MTDERKGLVLLRATGVTKRFPGVLALDRVDFELRRGEVHALVGENGAGKSTFIKILGGVLRADAGTIGYEGKRIAHLDPYAAQMLGISIIHQESELALPFSAAENIFLGRQPRHAIKWLIDRRRMHREAQMWLDKVGARFRASSLVRDLSISQRRLVELARAVSMNAKLLIMDEPTTVFTEQEVEHLFEIVRSLKTHGVTTLYISHRLEEIYSIADRVTVLRDGKVIATMPVQNATEDKLVQWMVGRELKRVFPVRSKPPGEEMFSVSGLTKKGVIDDISFSVRKGEIVGLSGLVGAGRTAVANAIFGVMQVDRGEMVLDGRPIRVASPAAAIRHGIGFIPADRKLDGLLLIKSVKENISLANLKNMSHWSFIDWRREKAEAKKFQELLRIKTPSINQIVVNLSGGNQQKVVFARWLLMHAKVLILDEPTVGIDVGAKQEIYNLINEIAEEGRCVIMISSELPEVLGMCDRILVMHEGRIVHELSREEATQEEILYYSAGLHETASRTVIGES